MNDSKNLYRPGPRAAGTALWLMLALGAPGCHGTGGPDGDDRDLGAAEDLGGGRGDLRGTGGGLPCEVELVLTKYCVSCHGSPLRNGAPMRLETYADLTATSLVDPSKKVAERALARMKDPMRPMPPLPVSPVTPPELAGFEAWVNRGTPTGSCEPPDMAGPRGDMAGPPGDMAPPPSVCTSMQYWTRGNSGSQLMHPGRACITCHSLGRGPTLHIAGTVYPTVREPDDCLGKGAVTIEVTDATNKVVTLTTNSSGNFLSSGTVTPPLHAKLTYMGRTRAMAMAVPTGDCNSCHTQDGVNGAPGRIMQP